MSAFNLTGRMAELRRMMDLVHTPMFLVLVEEDGGFRFGYINRAHSLASGLSNSSLAGKTPDEVLPPRIADTVVANYAKCIDTALPPSICATCKAGADCVPCISGFDYQEYLELPGGRRWWKTHLSPVGQNGRVIALIGHSHDITDDKSRMEEMTRRFNDAHRSADDLRMLSRASTSHLRGPLHQIISFSELLKPELRPPMETKLRYLHGIRDAARDAIEELDQYEEDAGGILAVSGMQSDLDLGHLCRDTAALVDPSRALNISFPDITIQADGEAVRWIVVRTMERIAAMVGTEIVITLTPDGMRQRTVKLGISCDLIDPDSHGLPLSEREKLIAGAQVRGIMTEIVDRALPGGRRGMAIGFTVSGRVSDESGVGAARSVRNVRSGRATC